MKKLFNILWHIFAALVFLWPSFWGLILLFANSRFYFTTVGGVYLIFAIVLFFLYYRLVLRRTLLKIKIKGD